MTDLAEAIVQVRGTGLDLVPDLVQATDRNRVIVRTRAVDPAADPVRVEIGRKLPILFVTTITLDRSPTGRLREIGGVAIVLPSRPTCHSGTRGTTRGATVPATGGVGPRRQR